MSENSPEPRDPWAPPERPAVDLGTAQGTPSVHEQPTFAGMPGADTAGPAPAAYGYPAQPDPGGYAYPGPQAAQQTYGYPGYPGYPGNAGYPAYGTQKSNGFGVTALVLGILAVVGCVTSFIAVALGIGAVVFGAVGKSKANRGQADNGGMALAGIILGAIGIVLGGLMLALVFTDLMDRGPLGDYPYDSPYSDSGSHEKV